MVEAGPGFVVCKECGLRFGQITGKHLKSAHGINTVLEYQVMFPDAEVYSEDCKEAMGSWQSKDVERNKRISEALAGRDITWGREISEAKFGVPSTRTSEEFSETTREVWNQPGYRERMREVHKKLWEDPKHKDRQVSLMRSGATIHPNRPESELLDILEGLFPGEWKYNDGWLIIGGKVPDLANVNGQKKLIEVFGSYWHGPEFTEKTEEDRKGLYSQYGYDTLIVWEEEVYYGNYELLSKLKGFCGSGAATARI